MEDKGKKKDMSRLEILVAGLVCGLIVSLIFNVIGFVLIVQLQDYRLEYGFLVESYGRLQKTYSPKPPISKSQAMDIVSEDFNPNVSKGIGLAANLSFVMFLRNPNDSEFVILHEIIADVSDYRPREICLDDDCITFRYVWAVTVREVEVGPGPTETITRQGEYLIDASTGEIILLKISSPNRQLGT